MDLRQMICKLTIWISPDKIHKKMDPTMGAVGLTSGSESMIDEIGLEF